MMPDPSGRDRADAAGTVIRTLLLTDLVDSTKLVEQVGDSRAFEIATRHTRAARDLLPRFGGREIDKTDGFLLLFDRPHDAVGYALRYHLALEELSRELDVRLLARVGIHLGEVFLIESAPEDVARGAKPLDVEGLAKPTTARVAALAEGGQTLLTGGAFNLARQASRGEPVAEHDVRWMAHGPYDFKGLGEPIEIFEVGLAGLAPLAAPADTEKARRAVAAGDELTLGWRPAPGQEIPGRRGWILERNLGEGGFGEVWLATQKDTAEQRAFKFCYEAQRLRALQREVTLFRVLKEALGDRDDIARILDWNFDEAPYFLESEYTEAGSLVTWAEEQGGLERIPLATRLDLVAQVAEALAAAHSVGVLHKDVKPANVLISTDAGGSPRIHLTDFGIGLLSDRRVLAAQGITALGMTEALLPGSLSSSGTRLYMAPELLEGKPASVQADIYALGVVLYQMTVGDFSRVLASGWSRYVDDELLAEDIADFVDGAPARRPMSALEIAERLRHLDERRERRDAERRRREEEAAARRAFERSQRRRRIYATVALCAVVVLTAVSILALQAMEARRVADRRRDQAEGLISFMVGDLRDKLKPLERLDILDDVGEKALAYFAEVPEENLSDGELLSRSKALSQIGDLRIQQGRFSEAIEPFRESLALAKSLVARAPGDAERQFGLGQSHYWVGFVLWRRGDLSGALEQFRSYLAVSELLIRRDPENADWQLELAYAHINIATVLADRVDLEEALAGFQRGEKILESLLERDPNNTDWRLELALTHDQIAGVLAARGDLPGSLENRRREYEILTALADQEPDQIRWRFYMAVGDNHLGGALLDVGETEAALGFFQQAAATLAELTANDQSNANWQRDLASNNSMAGAILTVLGDLDEASKRVETARSILEEVLRKDPEAPREQRDLAVVYLRLGTILEYRADYVAAHEASQEALRILSRHAKENPGSLEIRRRLSAVHLLQGRIFADQGDSERARSSWIEAAKAIEEFAADSNDPQVLDPWARALSRAGRSDEAGPVAERLHALGYKNPSFLEFCREQGIPWRTEAR